MRRLHVGFTGTQAGMTQAQKTRVLHILNNLGPFYGHHGDCIGSDADFHGIAFVAKCVGRVIHPPLDDKKRAFCEIGANDIVLAPLEYMARNREIVKACARMIATPEQAWEKTRSGTWSTIRSARRVGVPLAIVAPDGGILYERWP